MKNSVNTTPLPQPAIPIIKIVGNSCNLRCGYCYYIGTDQSVKPFMSYELLEKFLTQYMEIFKGRLIFIWHGGEPLLAGLPFFSKIIEIQEILADDNQEIQNHIQTNATLITHEWGHFFKKYDFRVGVSLDGDKESHNRFRQKYGKNGSFEYVIRGIKILREYDIEPGIIQTITTDNLRKTRDNFDFFTKSLGIKKWGTNIYNDIYSENEVMIGQSLTNNQLAAFLTEQFDLWLQQEDPNLVIREIEDRIFSIFGKRARTCTSNGSCAQYFCIEQDGKIYPCDKSSGRQELLLGDISKQSLLEVLNSDDRLTYAQKVNTLPIECRSCQWRQSCNNGCTMQRTGGIDGKYYFCEAQKIFFAYLQSKLSGLGYLLKTQ